MSQQAGAGLQQQQQQGCTQEGVVGEGNAQHSQGPSHAASNPAACAGLYYPLRLIQEMTGPRKSAIHTRPRVTVTCLSYADTPQAINPSSFMSGESPPSSLIQETTIGRSRPPTDPGDGKSALHTPTKVSSGWQLLRPQRACSPVCLSMAQTSSLKVGALPASSASLLVVH